MLLSAVTNYVQTATGNNMCHFSADLPTPVPLQANARYFISIVDSMPTAYATWGWAQGFGGNGKTFYYQIAGSPAGGPYYSLRPGDRAFLLGDASPVLTGWRTATNGLALSWPTNATDFVLQQSSSLATPSWANATNAITVVGTDNRVSVSVSAEAHFYRLMRP